MKNFLKIFAAILLAILTVYLFKLKPGKNLQTDDPRNMAVRVVQLLSTKEWASLAKTVHPKEGVYLSKFAFVSEDYEERAEQTLMPDEVAQINNGQQIKKWMTCSVCDDEDAYEELTMAQFINRHIYDYPFTHIDPGSGNVRIGSSQIMNNIESAFSGEIVFYEFHKPDEPDRPGSWKSLRVILKKEGSKWYWVGVVHDAMSI